MRGNSDLDSVRKSALKNQFKAAESAAQGQSHDAIAMQEVPKETINDTEDRYSEDEDFVNESI